MAKLARALAGLAAAAILAACGKSAEAPQRTGPAPAAEDVADGPVDVWLERLEVGSREIYSARNAIAAAVSPPPGGAIADIGAGTGIYTMLFAEKIGPSGAVYAVDIEPRFLKLINQRAEDSGLQNIVSVLSRADSVTLPPASVDAVFICDTYHYFDDPAAIMATVRTSLKPGGALYVVDYDLKDGREAPPEHRHVRFGKAGVAAEIEAFGFGKAEEISVPGLAENYMLKFVRTP